MKNLLSLKNITISLDNKVIIDNLSLNVDNGDCVCILGQNGEGKSTILKAIYGYYGVELKKGSISFDGKEINSLDAADRCKLGIFTIHQNPVEIDGVNQLEFYRTILLENGHKTNISNLYKNINKNLEIVNLNNDILQRDVNFNFSGGEKKKNELIQMLLINPRLILIDEIDSGLDVDSLKTICSILIEEQKKGKTIIFITHNKMMIESLKPNKVSLIYNKGIVHSGDYNFGLEIINDGFTKTYKKLGINIEKKQVLDACIGGNFEK